VCVPQIIKTLHVLYHLELYMSDAQVRYEVERNTLRGAEIIDSAAGVNAGRGVH